MDKDAKSKNGVSDGMEDKIELRTPQKVELVEVIHTEAARGDGTEENPVRIVHQYWDKKGSLLAEKDDY